MCPLVHPNIWSLFSYCTHVITGSFQQVTDHGRSEWDITEPGPLIKTWCDQIKFLQRIVIGLYLGLYKEKNISLPGGKIVGPPYWQIKRINPFFILNPFPYHKIMKIQIPPSSQILNCTHNITPGLKRKRGRKKKNVPCLQPSQIVAQVLFVLNFFQ